MKTALKISYRAVAIVMLVLLMVGMFVNRATEEASGSYTSVTSPMTTADKRWVQETFGEYETFEELLFAGMIPFATEHFVYDDDYNHYYLTQTFNFGQFRREQFHGVCYQFSQWAKAVGVQYGVKSYVVDVRLDGSFNRTHSYNFFVVGEETYFVDFTMIVSRHNQNLPYGDYAKRIGDMPYMEYVKKVLKDDAYRVY
jgi:hypothetical protein